MTAKQLILKLGKLREIQGDSILDKQIVIYERDGTRCEDFLPPVPASLPDSKAPTEIIIYTTAEERKSVKLDDKLTRWLTDLLLRESNRTRIHDQKLRCQKTIKILNNK